MIREWYAEVIIQMRSDYSATDPSDVYRRGDYYIEINPQFGGGAPLSIKAGADNMEAIIRMLRGEELTYIPSAARDGAIYSRFDQSIL